MPRQSTKEETGCRVNAKIRTVPSDRRSFLFRAIGVSAVTLGSTITNGCIPTVPACDSDYTTHADNKTYIGDSDPKRIATADRLYPLGDDDVTTTGDRCEP